MKKKSTWKKSRIIDKQLFKKKQPKKHNGRDLFATFLYV